MVRIRQTARKSTIPVTIKGYYDYYHQGPAGDKLAAKRIWKRDTDKRWNAKKKEEKIRLEKLKEFKKNKNNAEWMKQWMEDQANEIEEASWSYDDYHNDAYIGETSTPDWVLSLYG